MDKTETLSGFSRQQVTFSPFVGINPLNWKHTYMYAHAHKTQSNNVEMLTTYN